MSVDSAEPAPRLLPQKGAETLLPPDCGDGSEKSDNKSLITFIREISKASTVAHISEVDSVTESQSRLNTIFEAINSSDT